MRKKIFTFLLALAASVGMMNAAVDDSGSCGANVTYSFNGTTGEMTITGTGPMTDYASISDVPWNSYRDDITSVTITDGVTTVGSNSFGYHKNLVTVTIGNDVETIGAYAFGDCYKFTTLNLGNSVRHIGDRAFMWAKVLTGFTLPSTLETIGERAFLQNKVITTLTIPSNVTSIEQSAFFYCAALTSITVEATTPPTLGETVFNYVPTSIPLYVPNGSVAAYDAAAQWTDFDIQGYDPAPASTNVCGDGLTWELNGGVLTISYDGVGTGEMYDFDYEYDENPVNVAPWKENKSAITTVIVGDGVKSIGNYAFNDLYENFTAVTIANSVERIGVFAFTNAKWITEITLPSSLKTIDRQCFSANFGITSITIPSGVTSIGYQAFSYCKGLTSLTCEATTPPTLASGVFSKIRQPAASISSIPLYVPSGSVAAYEAAAQWNAFDIHGYDPTPAGPIPCTAADLGKVLCTDGSIYATVSEATAASKTVAAVITYVDTENGKALALALANESGTMDWETAKTTAAAHTPAVSGGTWTLASKVDWDHMINAAGGYNALRDCFSGVGGTNIQKGQYWTSTEYDSGMSIVLNFGTNDGGYFVGGNVDPFSVRACLAFDISAAPAPAEDVYITPYADPQHANVYYSTFFDSAKKYALPAGVEAYVADLSGANLLLTKIAGEGQTIPADNAVILKSSVTPFTLTVSDADAVTFTATNSLKGVDVATPVTDIAGLTTANCYVLSGTDQYGVGFYKINGNQLKAHKAYVKYNGSQNNAPRRMRFVFNQEQVVTGIDNANADIKAEKRIENGVLYIIKNGVRYNVQGQIVK